MTVFNKQYLMTAGPTPLPPAVSQVMAEPILYHRAPAFIEIYARALERLARVFQTDGEVLVFAASGTGAMESAVANMVAPGDVAVVASCGKFGQRWAELSDAYGAETVHLEVEWGERIDPALRVAIRPPHERASSSTHGPASRPASATVVVPGPSSSVIRNIVWIVRTPASARRPWLALAPPTCGGH